MGNSSGQGRSRLRARLLVIMGAMAWVPPAFATLGETADSVETDRQNFSAVRKGASVHANYSVEEIASASGSVREYVSADGVVFAIAWTGLRHPDLQQLLGAHFAEYQRALLASPRLRGRRSSAVKSSTTLVQKWGHMRKLGGRAVDLNNLPAGVSFDEIK